MIDDLDRAACPFCHQPIVTLAAAPNTLARHNTRAPWQPHPTTPGVLVPQRCAGSGAVVRRPERAHA